jgi:hypothetical protein
VNGYTGHVNLTKNDIGLGNVDNTSDANKPISTAVAAALATKYDASNPSGYVNAAGAAAVAPVQSVNGQTGAVTLTKADVGLGNVDNTSDANKPISTATQAALDLKVSDADVKGGCTNLAQRLTFLSQFAGPFAGGIISGQYYDNSFHGAATSTLAGVANRLDLAPFFAPTTFSIDRLGVAVSTAVAGALAKVVIYNSDTNGWPGTLLFETADLDCSTAALREDIVSFTFQAGVKYWLGVVHNSTATLRTIPVSSAVNLGLTSGNGTAYATILRRTVTYANLPSPWNFTNSDRVAGVTPPSIRFRVA